MDERAKSLGRIQPPVRSWLGGYISPRMARDERGMTRLVPRDALDDGTTRSRRGRCDHARRVRPDRAPARPASRVSRRHLTRRSAKSMGWNPKNPMVRGCGRGPRRSTAAILTDFLSALSHPVESNAKGNARRPLATPSVPVEEGYGARRTRNIEKLGSRLGQKLHPTSFTAGQNRNNEIAFLTGYRTTFDLIGWTRDCVFIRSEIHLLASSTLAAAALYVLCSPRLWHNLHRSARPALLSGSTSADPASEGTPSSSSSLSLSSSPRDHSRGATPGSSSPTTTSTSPSSPHRAARHFVSTSKSSFAVVASVEVSANAAASTTAPNAFLSFKAPVKQNTSSF